MSRWCVCGLCVVFVCCLRIDWPLLLLLLLLLSFCNLPALLRERPRARAESIVPNAAPRMRRGALSVDNYARVWRTHARRLSAVGVYGAIVWVVVVAHTAESVSHKHTAERVDVPDRDDDSRGVENSVVRLSGAAAAHTFMRDPRLSHRFASVQFGPFSGRAELSRVRGCCVWCGVTPNRFFLYMHGRKTHFNISLATPSIPTHREHLLCINRENLMCPAG